MLLKIDDLKMHFFTTEGVVKAVDGMSLSLENAETLALVGESGSGKSSLALAILKILPATGRIVGGKVLYKEKDLVGRSEKEMKDIRGKEIAIVFQNPLDSLSPYHRVGDQIVDVIRAHASTGVKEARKRVIELLELTRIPDPEVRIDQYPLEFSMGMAQRVAIARAIACNPSVLIADEPTSNLDVTIQTQILILLKELKERLGMSMMLITHDMGVVAENADRAVILYAGRICESGDVETIFDEALHPYTQALISAVPRVDEKRESLRFLPGNIPDMRDPPSGCRFHTRCKYARAKCKDMAPDLEELSKGHHVACWLVAGGQK